MPNIQLQFRRDTSTNWNLNNPILASGEMGIEMDTQLFKIGTGLTGWRGLTYGGLRGPGTTGITGVGISFMTINNAGILNVSYTNGVTTAVGSVVGSGGISYSGPTGSILYYSGSSTTGTSGLSYGGGALLSSGTNFLDLNRFGNVVVGSTGAVTIGNALRSYATINDQFGNIQLSTSGSTGNIRLNPGTAVVVGDSLYSQVPGNSVLKVDMITSLSGASGTTGQVLGVSGGKIAWVSSGLGNSATIGVTGGTGIGVVFDGTTYTVSSTILDSLNNVTVGTGGLPTSTGNSVSVGYQAGSVSQKINTVAVGYQAAQSNQDTYAVAIGSQAGQTGQGAYSVAIGSNSGKTSQSASAIAIGRNAGNSGQGTGAIAIGNEAAMLGQGNFAIAIGTRASGISAITQPANTIILNASGAITSGISGQTGSFYVTPIRNSVGTNSLQYNPGTKEITYGPLGGGSAIGVTGSGGIGVTFDGTTYTVSSTSAVTGGTGIGVVFDGTTYTVSATSAVTGGTGIGVVFDGTTYTVSATSAVVGSLGSIQYSNGSGGVSGSTGFAYYPSYTYAPGVTFNNFLTSGINQNGIAFDDGQGNMLIKTGGTAGNISVQASDVLQVRAAKITTQINGVTGTTGQFLGSDGVGNVTWLPVGFGFGNVMLVDAIKGVDATATVGRNPFRTIEAAIAVASTDQLIWVMPGTYYPPAGILLPGGVSIRGASVQNTVIEIYNPGVDTDLLTLEGNNRVEDLTLRLIESSHVNLRGIVLSGASAYNSKIRTCVITVNNSSADGVGTSDVFGVEAIGPQITARDLFSKNCLKGSTISVLSNGGGRKRGILVSGSSTVTTRDLNVYVALPADNGADSTGSYVGVETNDNPLGLGSIQLRSTTIQGSDPSKLGYAVNFTGSDILQTTPTTITDPTYLSSPGIQIGPGVDLVQKSAGSRGFSTWVYPTTIFYGLKGNLSSGSGGYLWPGTQAVTQNVFPDIDGTLPAYYRCQQPTIISGFSVGLTVAPGFSPLTMSIWYSRAATPGTLVATPFTLILTSGTSGSFYNASVSLNTGDRIHVLAQFVRNLTQGHDLTVQVDLF